MQSVIRALVVYLVLLLLFRIAGKRTLAQVTTFDLVLTLIISEAIQQAMIDDDNSLTNGILIVFTLVALDIALGWLKHRSNRLSAILDGKPMLLVDRGRVRREWLDREQLTEGDVLRAARHEHGIGTMDGIRYAVLEDSGGITVIPEDGTRPEPRGERRD
ncbi:MAG TPA: YetF domain-containing protein [Gemmatimonadaceae bacterium]|nr:YetF domain-containing protein [Gemmatimonadaceae bacterium]